MDWMDEAAAPVAVAPDGAVAPATGHKKPQDAMQDIPAPQNILPEKIWVLASNPDLSFDRVVREVAC